MKYGALVLLFMYAILPATGIAQEQATNRKQTDAGERQQEKQIQSAEDDDGKSEISPDIRESFRPSEEISEDLSVSFPVDI